MIYQIGNFLSANFMIYSRRLYNVLLAVVKVFASSILYNIVQFSVEIVNTIFLAVLFITCLYYFLKSKDNFVKEVS